MILYLIERAAWQAEVVCAERDENSVALRQALAYYPLPSQTPQICGATGTRDPARAVESGEPIYIGQNNEV